MVISRDAEPNHTLSKQKWRSRNVSRVNHPDQISIAAFAIAVVQLLLFPSSLLHRTSSGDTNTPIYSLPSRFVTTYTWIRIRGWSASVSFAPRSTASPKHRAPFRGRHFHRNAILAMKVLCVAEKPSIARSITEILSGGHWETRDGIHKYTKNYCFPYKLPPPLGPPHGDSDFTVTSVLGHLTGSVSETPMAVILIPGLRRGPQEMVFVRPFRVV